jgi:serine protease Do
MNVSFFQRTLLSCVLLLVAGIAPAVAQDQDIGALEEQAFKQAAALANPSVVRIETVGGLDRVGDVLTGTGPTTGVVVSEDGYIISSAFNFVSKPASILVTLTDDRRFPAKQVATDHSKMLTLLKIEAGDLTPAEAAPLDSIRVGQWAIALGRTYDNAFPSVSVGIVSALNRVWGKALQTDAKVSPVNYGGPLVNVEGRTMGILVPLSPQATGETTGVEWYDSGIGFAIPMEDIYAALDRLKTGEDLQAGLMGITFKDSGDFSAKPVLDRVRYGSPAQKAGLEPGDEIVEVDGVPVVRQPEFRHVMGKKYAGETVAVTFKRGEETNTVDLALVGELQPYESAFLGILPVRPGEDPDAPAGVGIRYVYAGSPAEKAGLQPRDVIVRFNDEETADRQALAGLVSRLRPEEQATITFLRDGEEQTAEVALAAIPNSVPSELRSPVLLPPAENADNTEDAEEDEKQPKEDAPKTGRFTHELPDHEHSAWAYVPDDYNPAHQYGLMVWIHPGGDTMEAAVYRQWKSICDRRGIILLAPKAQRISGWNPDEAEFVQAVVEDFQETYAIDPARIFLHGHSTGGMFAYHLAFKQRELFRGVAASAALMQSPPPENQPDHPLQFHLVCGDKHPMFRIADMMVKRLQAMKFPISFTVIKDHGDKYPADEPIEEIGRWADSLDRI